MPLCPHSSCPSPLLSPRWWALVYSLYLWVCFCFVIFIHLFYFLDSTYKWWHTVGSVCLSLSNYFTRHGTLQVHSCCCKGQNVILFVAKWYLIPSGVCVCVCLHHIFIQSSVDGHVGCFHIASLSLIAPCTWVSCSLCTRFFTCNMKQWGFSASKRLWETGRERTILKNIYQPSLLMIFIIHDIHLSFISCFVFFF